MATLYPWLKTGQKLGDWTLAGVALTALLGSLGCSKAQPGAESSAPAVAAAPVAAPTPAVRAAPPKEAAPAPKETAGPAGAAAADRELEPEAWDAKQAYGEAAEAARANEPAAAADKAGDQAGGAQPRPDERKSKDKQKSKEDAVPPLAAAQRGQPAQPAAAASAGNGAAESTAKAVGRGPAAGAKRQMADAAEGLDRNPVAAPTGKGERGNGDPVELDADGSRHVGALRRDRSPVLIARPQPTPTLRPSKPAVAQVPYRSPDKQVRRLPAPVAVYPKDARYRSTYLPGRGYLQHLQQSVQQTSNQQAAGRGDAGLAAAVLERARPTLPPPQGSALKVAIDLSHKQLPAQGGQVTVRVRLRAAEQRPTERMPLRLHLVVDSSGSMKGKPWQQVCAAVELLSQRLLPTDQMSITVFSETAQILAPPTPGGAALAGLARQVCQLKPRGETNTFAGLQLGYQQARSAYSGDATNRVLLISDGMATVGPREPYEITADTSKALGQGITTSGLGIGRDFDALLMNRIALEGGGNHHFVRDAAALPAVVVDELEVLSHQAAEAVDVRISLPEDVALLEVVGSEPLGAAEALRARQVEVASDQRIARDKGIAANRQRDFDGGVRFLLPAFRAGDEHAFVLVVQVPPGAGQREVARLAVRYKDLINKKNAGFVGGRVVQYAEPGAPALGVSEPDVLLTEARARAGHALQRASEYLDDVNLPAIRSELYSAAMQLQKAADATGSALVQAESARVQALADAATAAMQRRQGPWLAAVLHYQWRVCGLTAWAE